MDQSQRTMMKLSASEKSVSLRTVSRGFRSPHRFIVLERELQELEEKRHVISADIHSFAQMRLERLDAQGGDVLEIRFAWLGDAADGKLSGTEEILRFPWEGIKEGIRRSRSQDGVAVRMLSMKEGRSPKVEFRSRENLKAVAGKRALRKKLGRFLGCHFAWKSSRRIVVSDDFMPYSFCFREERADGGGMCGGIILHGQDDLRKAYYGLHT